VVDKLKLNEIVSKLRPMIENGNCIVWVGSGLSKNADYPDWKETVKQLCVECGVTPLSNLEEESPDKLIDKAELCKKKDIDVYHNTLANLFGGRPVNTRFAYRDLMRLPFKAYVTTNFDPLLSETDVREEYDKLYYYPKFPSELGNSHPIVYLHGHARPDNQATGENLILARSDFDEAYGDIGTVKFYLTHIFTYYSFLFLGCSLTEPVISKVFQQVQKINIQIKNMRPDTHITQRYIILPTQRPVPEISHEKMEQVGKREREEFNRFKKMDIEVLSYEPDDEERHEEIEEILSQLCKYIKMPKNAFESEEMP
jgi:hypothetical protein